MTKPVETVAKLIQPLPWTAESEGSGGLWLVRDNNGFSVLGGVTQDEAEFIVRACNSRREWTVDEG
jgi:hypothetical protein